MNLILTLTSDPVTLLLGLVLLHFLWQGALIAIALAGVLRLARHQSAAWRHHLACGALVLLLTAPVATLVVLTTSATNVTNAGIATMAPGKSNLVTRLESPPAAAGLPLPGAWLSALTWFWLTGVALFSLRFLGGWWQARRWTTREIKSVSTYWQDRLESLQAHLGLHRRIRLLESTRVRGPLLLGWLRPLILLPAGMLAGLPPAQIEAILLHELAHIRGHDFLINWIQRVAETVLFYHPAVWWVSEQIRRERELRCDDCVVQALGEGRSLANALLTLAERNASAPDFALAAEGGSVANRIRRLLGAHPGTAEKPTKVWRWALLLIVLVGMGIWLAPLATAPRMFQSTARIKIEAPQVSPANPDLPQPYDPYYLATQLELIRSATVVMPVVDQMGLAKRWGVGPSDALRQLGSRLQVRQYRNTAVVEITVASPDRQEAADLANAITEQVRNFSANRMHQKRLRIRAEDEQRLSQLDQLIEKAVEAARNYSKDDPQRSADINAQELWNEVQMLRRLKLKTREEIVIRQLNTPESVTDPVEIIDRAEPTVRAIRWYAKVR